MVHGWSAAARLNETAWGETAILRIANRILVTERLPTGNTFFGGKTMSEYQFYEFRCIDRWLTEKEQQEIGRWSSRTNPTATGASFEYHYSDFPKNPREVVGQYFDAMFHIANWGTVWLMFKFPKELLDREAITPFCSVDEISLSEFGDFYILELRYDEEEGFGWTEGEGCLSSLITLRQDILLGDYRSLYLTWLNACSQYVDCKNAGTELREQPLSRHLTPLNGALKSWAKLINLDSDILEAAATGQLGVIEESSRDLADLIPNLTAMEKDQFLLQLLQGEPLLQVKLRKRLQALSGQSGAASKNVQLRTVKVIFQEAEKITQARQEKQKQQQEARRRKKLKTIESNEASLWQQVMQHISEKKPAAYDAAIKILKDLLMLANHRGTMDAFEQRIQAILREYNRLTSLKSKIAAAKLLQTKP